MMPCAGKKTAEIGVKAAKASKQVKRVPSVIAEALNSVNPSGPPRTETVRCLLSVGWKKEIPVERRSPR